MQPQPIVQLVEVLQSPAGLHGAVQSLQLGKCQREQLFVAQRCQIRSGLCVMRTNDIVNANGGRRVAEIDATAEIADRPLVIDRRGRDESTDFRAAICVNVVGPFQTNIEILLSDNK